MSGYLRPITLINPKLSAHSRIKNKNKVTNPESNFELTISDLLIGLEYKYWIDPFSSSFARLFAPN